MSKTLIKSTSTVSAMTFISRISGFVRDMLAAHIFGVSASVDAFYIAFKIPNFMRNLFAEGSFSQAFVPVLSEYRQKKSHDEVKAFIDRIAGCLGSILLIITVIGVLATPLLIMISAPGLEPLRFHLASEMLRVTFPYLMLISLTAFAGSILNSYGAFAMPAFTPALLNIVLIITALWLAPHMHIPVASQAWGVLIAGVVQLVFLMPFLYRRNLLPNPRVIWRDEGVRRVLRLMIPAIFGASVVQMSLLLNTIFASFLPIGSVTWLYYSDRLAYFPLGVFGVALATVVLPHLSRQHAMQSPEQFRSALDWGLRLNLLIGIPASIMLLVFAGPMIATLFEYGRFHAIDVMMTRKSVIAYSVGLQAFMLVKLLSTGFYARQDIKTPVKIAIITMIINMVLNAILIWPLAHAGLALATSLSAWVNALCLFYGLYKTKIYQFQRGWYAYVGRLVFANTAMGILLWWAAGNINLWLNWNWHQRLGHLLLWLMLAFICYVSCLLISGMRFRDLA